MKVILYHKNTKMFEEKLSNYNFDYTNDFKHLKDNIKDYDALLAFGLDHSIDLSNLKWIQSLGAGVDWITTNPSLNENTIVTRITEGLEDKLFEYVLSKILYYYQNIDKHIKNQAISTWERNTSTSIKDKKVLIVGTGMIGSYIGRMLNLLGMEIYGVNSSGYDLEGFVKSTTFNNIDYKTKYDVVVNVLPSTKDTLDIFGKEFFNNINCDIFINVGRGDAVDVDPLVDKLNSGKIKMAFLDVFKEEPLKQDSDLWQVKNLHITPHIAGITSLEGLVKAILENYHTIKENKIPENRVSKTKGY